MCKFFNSYGESLHFGVCKLARYVRNGVVFWKNLQSWQNFYTTAGCGGRGKFQFWVELFDVHDLSSVHCVPWDHWRLKYTEVYSQQMAFTQSPSLSKIHTNHLICTVLHEVRNVTIASFDWWLRTNLQMWDVWNEYTICMGRGQQTAKGLSLFVNTFGWRIQKFECQVSRLV